MNWNKTGYRNNFSDQQMIIMDKRKKEEENRQREAIRKEEELKFEKRLLKYLTTQAASVTLQDISKELGISDKEALLVIKRVREIEQIVTPLNGENTSLTYALKR